MDSQIQWHILLPLLETPRDSEHSTSLTLLNLHVATCFCERNLAVVNRSGRLCKRRQTWQKPLSFPHCHQIQLISPSWFPCYFCPALGDLQAVSLASELRSASSHTSRVQRSLRRCPEQTDLSILPLTPTDSRGLWLLTVILPLDKGFPLTEPLHADTVDDAWRLLCLESLVQLGEQRRHAERIQSLLRPGGAPSVNCKAALPFFRRTPCNSTTILTSCSCSLEQARDQDGFKLCACTQPGRALSCSSCPSLCC